MIIVIAPLSNVSPSFIDRSKPVLIQTFISKLAVQALDKRILSWFTWLDETQLGACFSLPEKHRFTRKFSPVVADDLIW